MTWLDELIAEWHDAEGAGTDLSAHLGMPPSYYARFVEKPPRRVFGVDEVGTGAWAGPLVVAAVLAPTDWTHVGLKDSKAVKTKDRRAEIVASLEGQTGIRCFLVRTPAVEIDRDGMGVALQRAYTSLFRFASTEFPDALLVLDGTRRVDGFDHVALPKADSFVPQCMAASLIAKVSRDTEMMALAKEHPQYGFEENVGYGVPFHEEALRKHGPCTQHRKSYRPVRAVCIPST